MRINEFIDNAVQRKPAECCIKISQFQALYEGLAEGLKTRGITSEITDTLWLNLNGICPRCGWTITGDDIGDLWIMEKMGSDHVVIFGSGRAFRFGKGFCLNEKCSSTEIMLSWRPYYNLFQEKKDVAGLIKVLKVEKYWFARKKTAEALGTMGDPKAVEPLLAALKDENGDVRWKAVIALGEIGDKRAIDSLSETLEHEESYTVRKAAKEALEKIEGAIHF